MQNMTTYTHIYPQNIGQLSRVLAFVNHLMKGYFDWPPLRSDSLIYRMTYYNKCEAIWTSSKAEFITNGYDAILETFSKAVLHKQTDSIADTANNTRHISMVLNLEALLLG